MYKYFSPSLFFTAGQLLFVLPIAFPTGLESAVDDTVLRLVLTIHIFAIIIFFCSDKIGQYLSKCVKIEERKYYMKRGEQLLILLVLSIVLQVLVFKGIPAMSVLLGRVNIGQINDMNANSGGLLGMSLIISLVTIKLTAIQAKRRRQFTVAIICLSLINSLFQAKRQLLFLLIFTLVTFNADKVNLRRLILIIFCALICFSVLGQARAGGNIFRPLLVYIAIPLVNEMHLLSTMPNPFTGEFGVLSGMQLSLPSMFGGTTKIQGLPYPSGGAGMVGTLYYKSGTIGLTICLVLIGVLNGFLYKTGKRNELSKAVYAFGTWGLFASSTYILFFNVMFYLLPVTIFIYLLKVAVK